MRRFAVASVVLLTVLAALFLGGCSKAPAAKATIYYFYSPT